MDNDSIIKTGLQWVPGDIKKVTEVNANWLVSQAVIFLMNIQNILIKEEELKLKIHIAKMTLKEIGQGMQKNEADLQSMIQKQYQFEQSVNAFLGRTINFAWVDNKGNIIFTTEEIAINQVYKKANRATDSRKYLMGKILTKNLDFNGDKFSTNSLSIFEQLKQDYQNKIAERIRNHQNLFTIILSRYKKNTKENYWTKMHLAERNTFFWVEGTEDLYSIKKGQENQARWMAAKKNIKWSEKTTPGFLKQSHVNFIFNNTEEAQSTQRGISIWHKTFQSMERIPGLQSGDIIVKIGEGDSQIDFQIAVKSASFFNTASIGSHIKVAYAIIALKDELENLNVEKVKKILGNLSPYSNEINKESQKKVEEAIQAVLDSNKEIKGVK